jgi:ABC-type cobalt transport system substrate-binding protein
MRGSLLIAASLQLGAIVVGYCFGVEIHYPGRPLNADFARNPE